MAYWLGGFIFLTWLVLKGLHVSHVTAAGSLLFALAMCIIVVLTLTVLIGARIMRGERA